MADKPLDGMVALITGAGGGESGGIGAGIARCLARAGARVAVNDLTAAAAEATVAQLHELGAQAWPVVGDISDSACATALVTETAERCGQIDILVNNAGIGGSGVAVEHLSDAQWHRVMAVNLNGPFFTSRAAVRLMRPRRFGRIINIASIAAIRISFLAGAAYTASKEAVLGLTRHLAAEVTQHGITVNAVLPGFTITPLVRSQTTAHSRKAIADGIPAQRGADPEEIGALAAFLAGRQAGYITGAAIPVDGAVTVLPGDFRHYRAHSGKETGG